MVWPRRLCIASDFTKYDGHAVEQINRNIELIRYRRFADDLLMLELVNVVTATGNGPSPLDPKSSTQSKSKTVSEHLAGADEN